MNLLLLRRLLRRHPLGIPEDEARQHFPWLYCTTDVLPPMDTGKLSQSYSHKDWAAFICDLRSGRVELNPSFGGSVSHYLDKFFQRGLRIGLLKALSQGGTLIGADESAGQPDGEAGDVDDAPIFLQKIKRLGGFFGETDDPRRISSRTMINPYEHKSTLQRHRIRLFILDHRH